MFCCVCPSDGWLAGRRVLLYAHACMHAWQRASLILPSLTLHSLTHSLARYLATSLPRYLATSLADASGIILSDSHPPPQMRLRAEVELCSGSVRPSNDTVYPHWTGSRTRRPRANANAMPTLVRLQQGQSRPSRLRSTSVYRRRRQPPMPPRLL